MELLERYKNLEGLKKYIKYLNSPILRPSYTVFGSKTFRLTAKDPDIFQFPVHVPYANLINSCIRSPEGKLWIIADYSQLDLRIFGNLSGSKYLTEVFSRDLDPHKVIICKLRGKSYEEITSKERELGKRINYMLLYGASEESITSVLGGDSSLLFRSLFYGDILRMREEILNESRKGYIDLGYGLILRTFNPSRDLSVLFNAKIQFWSIKTILSAITLEPLISEYASIRTMRHDSLYILCNENNLKECISHTKEVMESPFMEGQQIPLKIHIHVSKDWN